MFLWSLYVCVCAVSLIFCCFFGVSINTSHFTTLIVAGCEKVTDTFLLRCFVPDTSTRLNLSSSTRDSFLQEPCLPAASSCHTVNGNNVASSKLNQCDDSASAFCRASMAIVTSKEWHNSVPSNCAQTRNIGHNDHCADAPELLCSSADSAVCQSVAAPVEVGDSRQECHQSATKYCSRKTCDNKKWTAASYKLEHLDMSGCWKLSDISIRCVYCMSTNRISDAVASIRPFVSTISSEPTDCWPWTLACG